MNDQMKEKEQAVLRWMKHLADEFEYIVTSPLKEKFKLSLIMIYIDIFSIIWVNIYGHRMKNRFKKWSNKFLFCEQNTYYVKNKEEFEHLDGQSLFELRCSLLHFGALRIKSQPSLPIFISSFTKREFIRKLSHQMKEQEIPFLVLCPKVISLALIKAIRLMADSLAELEKTNHDAYSNGMMNLYKDNLYNDVQTVALPLHIPNQSEGERV